MNDLNELAEETADQLVADYESGELQHWDECGATIERNLRHLPEHEYDDCKEMIKNILAQELPLLATI